MPVNVTNELADDIIAAHHSFCFLFNFTQPPATNEERFLYVQLTMNFGGAEITKKQYYPYRARGWNLDFTGDLKNWVKTDLPEIDDTTIFANDSWVENVRVTYGELIVDLDAGTCTETDASPNLRFDVANANYQFDEERVLDTNQPIICTHKPNYFPCYFQQNDWISVHPNGNIITIEIRNFDIEGNQINGFARDHGGSRMLHVPIGGLNSFFAPPSNTFYSQVRFLTQNGFNFSTHRIYWKNCPMERVFRELAWINPLGGIDTMFFEQSTTSLRTTKQSYPNNYKQKFSTYKQRGSTGMVGFSSKSEELISLSTQIDLIPDEYQWLRYLNGLAAANNYYIVNNPHVRGAQPDYLAKFIVDDMRMEVGNNGRRVNINITGRFANEYANVNSPRYR